MGLEDIWFWVLRGRTPVRVNSAKITLYQFRVGRVASTEIRQTWVSTVLLLDGEEEPTFETMVFWHGDEEDLFRVRTRTYAEAARVHKRVVLGVKRKQRKIKHIRALYRQRHH